MDTQSRYRTFHQLHESGCFVMPNPWDVGSARALARFGFQALATTSAGFAWSVARADGGVTLDQALAHLTAMAAAVDVPFNADFEGGFAIEPEGVAANVARAGMTGVAGLSIEDSTRRTADPLFEFALSVERIRAARRAIDDRAAGVLLTARSEGFIVGRPDLAETIRRLVAYADAGADCLFAPGITSMSDVKAIVAAVSPKPVNVIVHKPFTTVAELTDAGVRRISIGGALARVAWSGLLDAAQEIATHGTFDALGRGRPGAELNAMFGSQ
jgi:2-methylisocitrate lyase-like PEP mutase family enzyme